MPGNDEYRSDFELPSDMDEEMQQFEQGASASGPLARSNDRRLKFSDAYACYTNGDWEHIPEDLKRRYITIMRRSAHPRTFTSPETRERATTVLTALGIPLESERAQKKKADDPLPPVVAGWVEKSRRKLVDRQKRLMLERLGMLHAEGVAKIPEPGPYQQQAIDELIAEGKAVLIRDEEVQIVRGAKPRDGSPRRKQHVVTIALPFDEAKYREELAEKKDVKPGRMNGTFTSYPHTPGLWPEVLPEKPAEDEDDLI